MLIVTHLAKQEFLDQCHEIKQTFSRSAATRERSLTLRADAGELRRAARDLQFATAGLVESHRAGRRGKS